MSSKNVSKITLAQNIGLAKSRGRFEIRIKDYLDFSNINSDNDAFESEALVVKLGEETLKFSVYFYIVEDNQAMIVELFNKNKKVLNVNLKFSTLRADRTPFRVVEEMLRIPAKNTKGIGNGVLLERSELENKANREDFLPGDCLTFLCDFAVYQNEILSALEGTKLYGSDCFPVLTETIEMPKRKGQISLTIQDFLAWSFIKTDSKYQSEILKVQFGKKKLTFCLRLWLNENSLLSTELCNMSNESVFIHYIMAGVKADQKPFKQLEDLTFFCDSSIDEEDDSYEQEFCTREELAKNQKEYLPGGSLTICCDFLVYRHNKPFYDRKLSVANNNHPVIDTSIFDDLKCMWKNQLFTDFALVCDAQVLPCHKSFLANRSDVFKAMLSPWSPRPARL